MKRLVWSITLVLAAGSLISATALAERPAGVRCFSGLGGTCTVTSATSGDLDTSDGGFAGLFLRRVPFRNAPALEDVSFSFAFSCPGTPCVTGGSPRWSIPINGGLPGSHAFVDAQNCGQTGLTGVVDNSCPVFFEDDPVYADWAAFAAANPTYTLQGGAIPFMIADQPFDGSISGFTFTF